MTPDQLSENEVQSLLTTAETHLEEVENALWQVAVSEGAATIRTDVEQLTRRVWTVQHRLCDIQNELEQTSSMEYSQNESKTRK